MKKQLKKCNNTVEEMIQELEKGLIVPGTTIGRSLVSTRLLEEQGIPITAAERISGSVIGWSVSHSDMAIGLGAVFYHRTLRGALETALKNKRAKRR